MVGRVIVLASALSLAIAGAAGDPIRAMEPAAAADCAALSGLEWPGVKITQATAVPAASSGAIRVAHCRVDGVVDREIRFSLLLPEQWNRKFVMGGGGGFVAGIDNQSRSSINDGYATVGTDTGHQGAVTTAAWALNDLERQLNFGYLAVHRVAEVSKGLVRTHYGAAPARAYFNGCSNGGRQALMEAQRYPADFDGIVAGAPAYDFTGIGAQFIKDIQAAFPDPKNLATPMFSREVLAGVEAQIVGKCDALDGATDGLIEDPRRCAVDVAALTGVTDAQRTALKAIYGETRNQDGAIYPAQPLGGEGDPAGWNAWIVGVNPGMIKSQNAPSLRFAFGTEMFKYFIFNDPSWDYSRYQFSNFSRDAAQASRILNATNPNLDAFKAAGGKLVIWHGWSDPALSALGSVKYYEQVQAHDAGLRDYARMFMLPGVLHCAGGPGPDVVDWPAVIDGWVEKGQAPDRIVARKMAGGAATRTRPLCPYPQRAAYSGAGSLDDEKNFVCQPHSLPPSAAQTAELKALVAKAPKLPLGPAAIATAPPRAGWAMGMVSWVAMDRRGTTYLLQRGDQADPVVAVDRGGRVLRSWGKGLYVMPHAIRVDPQGNVWTTDAASSKVIKFTPEGKTLMEIEVGGQPSPCRNNFCGTTDIAFGPGGRLFIADGYANARILEYTADGKKVREWGTAGTGPGEFRLPHSIAVDETGVIYVADRENGRVQRFDLDGKFLGEWSYGKTFSLDLAPGAVWLATQPRTDPNLSPGWLLKVDRKSGAILGYADATGLHGMDTAANGDLVIGPGPNQTPQTYRAIRQR